MAHIAIERRTQPWPVALILTAAFVAGAGVAYLGTRDGWLPGANAPYSVTYGGLGYTPQGPELPLSDDGMRPVGVSPDGRTLYAARGPGGGGGGGGPSGWPVLYVRVREHVYRALVPVAKVSVPPVR